jgi:hypothetical protein
LRGSGRLDTRLDTPPISLRHHPGSRIARVDAQTGKVLENKKEGPHPD